MTPEGLERTEKNDEEKGNLKSGKFRLKADDSGIEIEAEGEMDSGKGVYRYKKQGDSIIIDEGKRPVPPEAPAEPPVPQRKASVSADRVQEKKVVKARPKEDLHTPFLFLSGR